MTYPAMFRQIIANNRAGGWRKLKAPSRRPGRGGGGEGGGA